VEFEEAALAVLREEGRPLHWTVIQDLALKRGYLDPFTQRDIRKQLVAALAQATKDGVIDIGAGEAVIAHQGEWVQYSTPGAEGAEYIAICVPAFAMDIVHRDA